MTQDIKAQLAKVKAASYPLALLSESKRNEILQALADKLRVCSKKILTENADVRIEREDRCGAERLLRYCARPAFSGEKLTTISKLVEDADAVRLQ